MRNREVLQTDRRALEILRLSVARVAQSLNVQSEELPVVDADEDELRNLCRRNRGWNALCACIVGRIENLTDDCARFEAGYLALRAQQEEEGKANV